MSHQDLPKQYVFLLENYPQFMEAVKALGQSASGQGPLDEKTANLIQLAAGVAMRSEGAVHSHTRRAREAGASDEEIRHAILLCTSTIGFPQVSAAMTWASDVLSGK